MRSRLDRRLLLLAVAGLISESVYLVATLRLPWWRYGGQLTGWSQLIGSNWETLATCFLGLGVVLIAYLAGWFLVRTGKRGRGCGRTVVWIGSALFAATLFWLMPITSDLFSYLGQAHLLVDLGRNPLLVAPLDVPGDGLLWAYPARYALQPSVYGPAWILLSAPAAFGSYDVAWGLLYLKGLTMVGYLGSAWLLEAILRQVRPASALEGLYLFTWNPLVLWMAVGDGHNDVVMMAAVLLAFWLMLRRQWVPGFGALALSMWIKYISALFFPLILIYGWKYLGEGPMRGRRAVLAGGCLVVVAVTVALFAPFWDSALIFEMASRFLHPVNWYDYEANWPTLALSIGLLLFGVVYLAAVTRFVRKGGGDQQLANATFAISLLAFVLGAARSQPWHLIWPAALAALSDRWWAWPVVGVLSALMLLVQVWVEWGAPGAGAAF